MGKQTQVERKWRLHLLFCVALFRLSSSAADINKTSPVFRNKNTGLTPSPTENTESTNPALVPQVSPSDEVQDVSVSCARTGLVVRVRPAFYGLGADASELRLGRFCQHNAVLEPGGDLLFKYPLRACDSESELQPGYLVYKFVLHYEPSPKRFPGRAHPVTVDIECRYPRNYHMHQLAIQPTWETQILHKRLKANLANFQIHLMDGTWENPVQSRLFQLGEMVNFQVSASNLPPGHKLFINSCYATPERHPKPPIRFTIIDNYGCLLDSKMDPGESMFVSRTDGSVRFSMKAFQFVTDPDAEISMHCELYISTAGPSPAHKSCTYMFNSWEALSGDDVICECCDSQCESPKQHRAMMDRHVSSESLWVSSNSDTSRINTNGGQKTTEKASELGETAILEHKDSGVTEIVMEELKWPTQEDQKVTVVESKADNLDLMLENDGAELLGYRRLRPLKEEDSQSLYTGGEKQSGKPADGNMKAEIKEVVEQENSGDDELNEKTWYFAWR